MSVMMLHTLCHILVHVHVPMWYGLTIYHTIIIFSGKACIRPIYQGINSICQGNGSPSIY